MFVNGHQFGVSKNLSEEALRHIRELQDSEPIFKGALWIDAICINQDDMDETSA